MIIQNQLEIIIYVFHKIYLYFYDNVSYFLIPPSLEYQKEFIKSIIMWFASMNNFVPKYINAKICLNTIIELTCPPSKCHPLS